MAVGACCILAEAYTLIPRWIPAHKDRAGRPIFVVRLGGWSASPCQAALPPLHLGAVQSLDFLDAGFAGVAGAAGVGEGGFGQELHVLLLQDALQVGGDAHVRGQLLHGGDGIISPESVKLMSTPHVPLSVQQRNKRWGLAVKVVSDESYESLPVGSFGWSGAYGTHFWVDPENKITAVYMKNSQYDGGGDSVTGKNFEWDVTLSMK